MGISVYPGQPTVVVAVSGTPTEIDRWTMSDAPYAWVGFENLDLSQSYEGWLESRAASNSGNWGRVGETLWVSVAPGESRNCLTPVTVQGAGELRFMATASGAGGNCSFVLRKVYL